MNDRSERRMRKKKKKRMKTVWDHYLSVKYPYF